MSKYVADLKDECPILCHVNIPLDPAVHEAQGQAHKAV